MVKINMMCGKRNFAPDWVHIDGQNYDHTVSSDIWLQGYKDVDLIYCSHGIAYFDREEIVKLLLSWRQALKPGGLLRLSTPDWEVLRQMDEPMLGPLYGKMNHPPIYHKTVYDEVGLHLVLDAIGFTHIRRYDHRLTEHAQFDDHSAAYHKGQLISLNIECNAGHR